MNNDKTFIWNFNQLPFVWSELSTPDNGSEIPNVLPFQLYVDETNGVLTQKQNNLVEKCLEKAYTKGSVIAGVMDDTNESTAYTDDFIDFLLESTNGRDISTLKVLEIGCGTGYLLSRIQKLGADVIGIEPGIHCLTAKEKYGVKIIHDFFPSKKITEQYDIIVMSIVLEHFQQPSKYLKLLSPYLNDNGLLIVSVPDAEPFIRTGDISTLFHEHYSYFTKDTLKNALNIGGFNPISTKVGKHGSLLFTAAVKTSDKIIADTELSLCYELANNYKNKATDHIEKLNQFLFHVNSNKKTLGVYVPSRFINFLLISNIDMYDIRFFDDNITINGKYYPGFNIQIESKSQLFENPTDIVLIFSRAFGEKIKNNIVNQLPSKTKIITWKELFEESILN
jgi:2-polyprenyl-3-methyl-5-hydroxy-6-metoxy-1,4-benzoquinol methylase